MEAIMLETQNKTETLNQNISYKFEIEFTNHLKQASSSLTFHFLIVLSNFSPKLNWYMQSYFLIF